MFVCHSPCAASWFHAGKTSCRQAMRFAFGGRRRWGRWLALWCLAWTQCNSDVQNMAESFSFRASHLCDAIHFGHLDQSLRELRRVVVSHGSCESQCVAARSRRGVVRDCRACHAAHMPCLSHSDPFEMPRPRLPRPSCGQRLLEFEQRLRKDREDRDDDIFKLAHVDEEAPTVIGGASIDPVMHTWT